MFKRLKRVAQLALSSRDDEARRELVRLLPDLEPDSECQPIADSLCIRLGLFPYLSDNAGSLSTAEQLQIAYHTPAAQPRTGFTFHAEQQRIFEKILDGSNVLLSAPTSFGKSALVDALVLERRWKCIIIIVPTIALIDETRRRLINLDSGYEVCTTPDLSSNPHSIYVLTQERFLDFESIPPVDFFVIDEFYKLGSGEVADRRKAALNIAWNQLKNTGAQYYLLGPNIEAMSAGVPEELARDLDVSSFDTVVVDVDDRSAVDNPLEDVRKYVSDPSNNPSLVFVSAVARAGDAAKQLRRDSVHPFASKVAKWLAENYHQEWSPTTALTGGVGLHTGPMPRSIQRAMIRLFEANMVEVLVCTTTLIEGVNTSAKSILIVDKKIDRQPIDFFTFSNIRGRAGRMLRHFVGKVVTYLAPPPPVEVTVDIPIESQSPKASLATLVQLKQEDLSAESESRLAEVFNQDVLELSTIRGNKGLDPIAQIEAATAVIEMSQEQRQALGWSGVPRSGDFFGTLDFAYDHLLTGKERRGENPGTIAGKLNAIRENAGNIPALVANQLKYKRSDQSTSDVVDSILGFQRNWMGFSIPSMLRSASAIVNDASTRTEAPMSSNYEFVIREIESLYLPNYVAELEEYGLPTPIGVKLSSLGVTGQSLLGFVSTVHARLSVVSFAENFTEVELWFIEDCLAAFGLRLPA